MTLLQPMAGPNPCLLGVKGRLHRRQQVCYNETLNEWIFYEQSSLSSLTDFLFNSNFRYGRSDEPEAHFTDENSSVGLCTLCCWHPTDPSDSTVHSWPGQPFCFSRPEASYCSCGTMLAVVRHSAEPTRHEERPETVVNLHRWKEANGSLLVNQFIRILKGPILVK